MFETQASALYLEAFWVAIACFLIARSELPNLSAALLAAARIAVPAVYFLFYYDGTWTVLDDVTYAIHGELLTQMGYTPWSILKDIVYLKDLAGGEHILFIWWNFAAQSIFGVSYHAPVFLNVLMTFVGGVFMVRMLREMGYSESYLRGFFVFFLLHWDILVWSSLINLKDVLVMTLTIISMYLLLRLTRRFELASLVGLVALGILFSSLRFYIPILLLVTTGFWLLLEWRNPRRHVLLGLSAVALLYLARRYAFAFDAIQNDQSILFGIVRFALTPQPWSIESQYSFLYVPSVLHWIMFVPMLLACQHLWQRSRAARLVLLYLLLVVMLYAFVPELQGPRHRCQIAFIMAWAQFHFLRSLTSFAGRPKTAESQALAA